MKKFKYIFLSAVLIGFTACSDDDFDYNPTPEPLPELTTGSLDFSTYVAVGASFTAGFTDNALFINAQENSFPNILSQQFASSNGGSFTQPLMSDNIGGLLIGGMQDPRFGPRLFFDGSGPTGLPATPTTETTNVLSGPFTNLGVPGAKSFHFVAPGYGNLAGVPVGAANPYFARMASSPDATVIGDAVAQNPTFFTLSEIGGNDVLGYATSGGIGVDQTGNLDPSTYGGNDITDPNVFAQVFSGLVDALTANGAKGAIANVPYITNLTHFTTVPHNPLSPANPSFGPLIPTLNGVFGQLNQVYGYLESVGVINDAAERSVVFSETEASAVLIKDETLTDISDDIIGVLSASPTFPAFVESFGLPAEAAPLVANLFGGIYGQTRQATSEELLVLPSSSIIGTVNTSTMAFLESQGLPASLAGQFSVEGVTNPLEDKWVLLPSEQLAIKNATDAYNATIDAVATSKGLAVVDFKGILEEASTTGISDGDFTLTTDLVTGGLVSLDGVHLTARGYAIMANKFLEAIDLTYGSNFIAAGVKANTGDYPTNYSPTLQ
ncbi:G-D-S-L family lipolytic protein [Winogradskyella sp. F6397]|uniref:G-D-S-L family lipolytic protein n=1 Tax=Winogradskyella marina TaxID=2785530 RepID=A0ABS0EH47_9FLAO|nr:MULTISPECIES: G-D-S-L family lipolytic protein [Winogradskyella]MBF8149759.1 G-D-S-L family lipolytic protein [Winogradskyella marina]